MVSAVWVLRRDDVEVEYPDSCPVPAGALHERCQALRAKIFRFSEFLICRMVRISRLGTRGVRVVTKREAECGGREGVVRRAALFADGEIVWSRRPDAGVKSRAGSKGLAAGRWWQTSIGSPRRARISRKTTAQGRPECLRLCLWTFALRAILLRGGPGCRGHPAFPAPSAFLGAMDDAKLGRMPPRGLAGASASQKSSPSPALARLVTKLSHSKTRQGSSPPKPRIRAYPQGDYQCAAPSCCCPPVSSFWPPAPRPPRTMQRRTI